MTFTKSRKPKNYNQSLMKRKNNINFSFFLPLKQMIKNRCFCILLKVSQRILSLGKLFYNRKKAGTLILRD